MTRLPIAIGVVVTELVLAIVLIIVLAGHVRAHDDPTGWAYSLLASRNH